MPRSSGSCLSALLSSIRLTSGGKGCTAPAKQLPGSARRQCRALVRAKVPVECPRPSRSNVGTPPTGPPEPLCDVAFHIAITSQAKQLGFEAWQRGEVRRRAGSLCSECYRAYSSSHSDGMPIVSGRELEAVVAEEAEGCRALLTGSPGWLVAVGNNDRKGSNAVASCDEATTCDDVFGVVGEYCSVDDIPALMKLFSSTSAALNHVHPLKFAMTRAEQHSWRMTSRVFAQFTGYDGVMPLALCEASVPRATTFISPGHAVSHIYLSVQKSTLRSINNSKGLRYDCTTALHNLIENELLDLRRKLRERLRLALEASYQRNLTDISQAQVFRESCLSHVSSSRSSIAVGSTQRHRKVDSRSRSLLSSRPLCVCPFAAANKDVPKVESSEEFSPFGGVNAQAPNLGSETGTTCMSPRECSSTLPTPEALKQSKCWEGEAIALWRLHRRTFLTKLPGGTLSNMNIKKGEDEDTQGCFQDAPFMSHDDVMSRLGAVVRDKYCTFVQLFVTLCGWIRRRCQVQEELLNMTWALEIVVFLLILNLSCITGEAALDELGALLMCLKEERAKNAGLEPTRGLLEDPLSTCAIVMPLKSILGGESPVVITVNGGKVSLPPVIQRTAELLSVVRSPQALHHTVSLLRKYSKFSPIKANVVDADGEGLPPELCEHIGLIAFLVHIGELCNLYEVISLDSATSPTQCDAFLVEFHEQLGNTVIAALREIHVRAKRPLPSILSDALWGRFVPLTIWLLRNFNSLMRGLPTETELRLVRLCVLTVEELSPRWNYSVVPARRRWIEAKTLFPFECEHEYRADAAVGQKVVMFASLIEGMLLIALNYFPCLLTNSQRFSRVCGAAGILLHDVDSRTGRQIMGLILQLRPPREEMDTEAHVAVVRCMSAMRHGCTLWEEAVYHYTCALLNMGRVGEGTLVGRQPRVSGEVATYFVLRCVGSSCAPRAVRSMLTLRIVAFACASGVPLNARLLASCLQNFTMRKSRSNGLFDGAPWCDALEWHSRVLERTKELSCPHHDVQVAHTACLQALLAQGQWVEALILLPTVEVPSTRPRRKGTSHSSHSVRSGVMALLALCASDSTRSCATAAMGLLNLVPGAVCLPKGNGTMSSEDAHKLCRIACMKPPVHRGRSEASRFPSFRPEAPIIFQSPSDGVGDLLIRFGVSELSYSHPRYSHEALMAKLEAYAHRLCFGPSKTQLLDSSTSASVTNERETKPCQPSFPVRIRARISKVFHLPQVVWSHDPVLEKTMKPGDVGRPEKTTRSLLDTRLASVLVPLQRLRRIRNEKRSRYKLNETW